MFISISRLSWSLKDSSDTKFIKIPFKFPIIPIIAMESSKNPNGPKKASGIKSSGANA